MTKLIRANLLAVVLVLLGASCNGISTYYANDVARQLDESELARVDLGAWKREWSFTLDGEPVSVQGFAHPHREILVPPGEHVFCWIIKRRSTMMTGGLLGLGLKRLSHEIFSSGPHAPEMRVLTPKEIEKEPPRSPLA